MMWLQQNTPITLEWIRSMATLAAVIVALVVALFGDWLKRLFFKPKLSLDALVRRPDAERVLRKATGPKPTYNVAWYEAWFFRLVISNLSGTPARDVQVYLKKVEKADGTNVEKFTPMNLRWTNTDPATPAATTRKVLLQDVPVFCDFIHISDPVYKEQHRENLNEVPALQAVMCLDVEATNSAKGHLLGPGSYLFHLYVAAENAQARRFVVAVQYNGNWNSDQDAMFDQEIGFRMQAIPMGSL
jgi:hypothetical protein